jgi:hypothetical protein
MKFHSWRNKEEIKCAFSLIQEEENMFFSIIQEPESNQHFNWFLQEKLSFVG